MAKRKTQAEVIAALKASGGIIAAAARRLGVSRSTVYRMINKHAAVRSVYDDLHQSVGDEMEGRLLKLCRSDGHRDQFRALQFYLSKVQRSRGYGDKAPGEADASGNTVIEVHHSIPGLPNGKA